MLETKSSAIIFDFDGTIADRFDIFIETLEEITPRSKPFSSAEIFRIRGSATKDIIQQLHIKKWQIPRLLVKGRSGMARKMDRVNIFTGLPEALTQLKASGVNLYVLSTNGQEAVNGFLNRYGLGNIMLEIYTGTSIFGKSKRLTSLLNKESLTPGHCFYVGDEPRDIEAAKKAGLHSVAVSWGYTTPETLKEYRPDMIVSNPANLITAIDSFSPRSTISP